MRGSLELVVKLVLLNRKRFGCAAISSMHKSTYAFVHVMCFPSRFAILPHVVASFSRVVHDSTYGSPIDVRDSSRAHVCAVTGQTNFQRMSPNWKKNSVLSTSHSQLISSAGKQFSDQSNDHFFFSYWCQILTGADWRSYIIRDTFIHMNSNWVNCSYKFC